MALSALFVLSLAQVPNFRPPAVPLVTSDPYLSIWSEADQLNGDVTRHWTHHPMPLVSLIRVDGHSFRLMGNDPANVPPLPQVGLRVTPTQTTYEFADSQVKVRLNFMTPALPTSLKIYSRPITYLTWTVKSNDGKPHRVQIFESTGGQIAVNEPSQRVVWAKKRFGALTALKLGSVTQNLFNPMGDDTRIDWGYAYTTANANQSNYAIGTDANCNQKFIHSGKLSNKIMGGMPATVKAMKPVLAYSFALGKVLKPISCHIEIGYDERYSIEYFGTKLRPYWRKYYSGPSELFQKADASYREMHRECDQFDRRLMAVASKVGGKKYAQILALSYRECVAANGLAEDRNHQPLLFTKEDTSNGDIATVDVIFPMDPIWIFLNPDLAKASLESNFEYAASPHWKFPNAPHDLGTYPQAFGRDDGGEGMPVEESGNMILLTDGIAQAEGSTEFANQWWPQLTQWANYLVLYGVDPEDQLCTDDFMGHLAHNANLSVKAILALAAYGNLCQMKGDMVDAKKFTNLAHADEKHWMTVAIEGHHSLLAFDKPGTWSQKYNMVWDQVLNLHIFPNSVKQNEIAYYLKQLQPYGLPLDSRTKLSKTDWTIWCATMANRKSTFEKFINPIYDYLDHTTSRDPIADSYITNDIHSSGMHARPVVGAFFIKLLADRPLWMKWSHEDSEKVGNWAPIPKPPVIDEIVPTSLHRPQIWSYTTSQPDANWISPRFDDSNWATGPGGFGTAGTPNAVVGTTWNTDDIWLRRSVRIPNVNLSGLQVYVYHDEDVQVYFNGILAFSQPGYVNSYDAYRILPAALKLIRPGAKIVIAVHCHQTVGGQGVDVGLCRVIEGS